MIAVWTLPVLFAITVHEAAHGYIAYQLGDSTAKSLGRVTLNPLRHIDWFGTIILPAALLFFTGFVFGWAKPVPINWNNLQSPRRDMALVALAGPGANLLMVFFWAMVAKLGLFLLTTSGEWAKAIVYMGYAGININLLLMLINLIPIPPLDGSRILYSFLPTRIAERLKNFESASLLNLLLLLFSLVLLLFSGILSPTIIYVLRTLRNLVTSVFGI